MTYEVNTSNLIKYKINNLEKSGMKTSNLSYSSQIFCKLGFYKIDIYTYYFDSKINKKKVYFSNSFDIMDIYTLYDFDNELRSLIFKICVYIESKFKIFISNCIIDICGCYNYLNINYFKNEGAYKDFILCIKNKKKYNNTVKYYIDNNINKCNIDIPIYLVCDVFTFGQISKLYANLQIKLKKKIINDNYTNKDVTKNLISIEGWLKSISDMRNICAHNAKLFDWKNSFKNNVALPNIDKYKVYESQRNSLFVILLIAKLLINDNFFDEENDDIWSTFINDLSICIDKHKFSNTSFTPLKYMGFPENWKTELLS